MLLLLLFLHQVWSEDVSKNTNFMIKKIDSCPDVGYFFRRESNPNSLPGCFLCFCQKEATAICWKREEKRCDVEKYHLHNARMKHKRSPLFGKTFSRDSANTYRGKKYNGECKPYESKFSADCPPDDWCIGCTVCDCNENRKWKCHKLRFCANDKGKQHVKKRKISKNLSTTVGSKITEKSSEGITNLQPVLKQKKILKKSVSTMPNKHQTTQRHRISVRFRNKSRKKVPPKKAMFIKKDVSTRKPVNFQSNPSKSVFKDYTDPKKMSKRMVKNMTAAKIFKNDMIEETNSTIITNLKKRSLKKKMSNIINTNKASLRPKFIEKHAKKTSMRKKSNDIKKKMRNNVTRKPVDENKAKRSKRDVFNGTIQLLPFINATETKGKIMDDDKKNNILLNNKEVNFNVTGTLTTNENIYYKYIVENFDNKTMISNISQDKNKTSNASNLNILEKPMFITNGENLGLKNMSYKLIYLSDVVSANELKNKRSSAIKLVKEQQTKNDFKQINYNKMYHKVQKKKITRKDIARKINKPKKFNLKKIIHTISNKRGHVDADVNKLDSDKINNLQYLVRHLLKDSSQNNTNIGKKKAKSILNFLKKFFSKIFRRGPKKNNKQGFVTFNRQHIISTVCESFGPCKIDARNRLLVKEKVNQLHAQTMDLLRTIQTIKGLLHLLDIPRNNQNSTIDKKSKQFINDKLNIIVRGTYLDEDAIQFPETQSRIIEYIKNNTNYFVKYINNFTTTLNEVVNVLTKRETNYPNRRVLRNIKKEDSIKSLKELLLKYNLVQNTFIKKIYEMLTKAEATNARMDEQKEIRTNNSASIETYSKNMINNLRRLKNLAFLLKSRKKRAVMRYDDAVEYLLMFMQYLLKQNYPLDVAPANDGIDLLIEAIRNAPDIKPARKKVLANPLSDIKPTRKKVLANPFSNIKPTLTLRPHISSMDEMMKMFTEEFKFPELKKEHDYVENRQKNTNESNTIESKEEKVKTEKESKKGKVNSNKKSKEIKVKINKEKKGDKLKPNKKRKKEKLSTNKANKKEKPIKKNYPMFFYEADIEEPSNNESKEEKLIIKHNYPTVLMESNDKDYSDKEYNGKYSSNKELRTNINLDYPMIVGEPYPSSFNESIEEKINTKQDYPRFLTEMNEVNVSNINQTKENKVSNKQDYQKFLPLEDFEDNDDDKYEFNRKNIENAEIFRGNYDSTVFVEEATKRPVGNTNKISHNVNNARNFNIFSSVDEDSTITSSATIASTTYSSYSPNTEYSSKTNKNVPAVNFEKLSKLDWIEENSDSENTEFKEDNVTTAVLKPTPTNTNPALPVITTIKPSLDVSSLTNELVDEKERRSKMKAEEVMFRKQMDLLNSLDYATEKSYFDEPSKDGGEIFPSYFV